MDELTVDHQAGRVDSGSPWEETGGYSRAVRRGRRIEVSGTTAHDRTGRAVHPGDVGAQTEHALRHALSAVIALGGRTHDVVRTRIMLVPDADWEQAARAHRRVFGAVRPANTLFYVHRLVGDGLLVEVEVEAEVADPPGRRGP